MSDLVAMILLAYLLVIALCVAVWSAVSLRRASPDTERADTGQPGAHQERATVTMHTHDAHRGAGRTNTHIPLNTVPAAIRAERTARGKHKDDRERDRESRPEHRSVDQSPTPRDQTDASREDARRDEALPPEDRRNEDAFERFLRANDDY